MTTADAIGAMRAAAAQGNVVGFQKACRGLLESAPDAATLIDATDQLLADDLLDFIDDHHRALSPLAAHWSEALLARVFTENDVRFGYELLALPPLFNMWGWRVTRTGDWQGRREIVMRPVTEMRCSGTECFVRCLAALFIDGLIEPLPRALERFFLADAPWTASDSAVVGKHLELRGWFMGLAASLPRDLSRLADLSGNAASGTRADPLTLLDLCGFFKTSDPDWCAGVFELMALPWMTAALHAGNLHLALALENRCYSDYVGQIETATHFRATFSRWLPDMLEAGRAWRGRLAPLPRPAAQPTRVGFFLFASKMLAHTRLMLTLFEGLRRMPSPAIEPVVYVYSGTDRELARRLEALGVTVRWLGLACQEHGLDRFARLLCLRELARQDGIAAMVYVCLPITMALAFSLGVAPRQIWWSVKHHALEFPEIDGYITTGVSDEPVREIDGRNWRTIPTAAIDLDTRTRPAAADSIRWQFRRFDVLLGSMGRPAKLENDAFLDALARILRANPRAGFLWFGHVCPPSLQARLVQLGIAEQCLFQGWVDTRVYAHVLDVHLDTFPFPLGLTMYETAAAGKAFVSFLSEESRQNGILVRLLPLLEGTAGSAQAQRLAQEIFRPQPGVDLLPCARTPDEYVELANRLIRDTEYRAAVGAAARRLVETFNDPVAMASAFTQHVLEIVDGPALPAARAGA